MLKLALALCAIMPLTIAPAMAQDISVPSVTTASPGGYANPLKLDTDRYDREHRKKTRTKKRTPAPRRQVARSCSAANIPASEQRRIEDGYMRRAAAEGKARADVWVQEEGVRYRMKLVRQGVCPAPTAQEMAELRAWRARTRLDR